MFNLWAGATILLMGVGMVLAAGNLERDFIESFPASVILTFVGAMMAAYGLCILVVNWR